jgi:peptidyl-prolyl cis-trans isomerase C
MPPFSADRYHLLRAATERFHAPPSALTAAQLTHAERVAQHTLALERRVLATPAADAVQITAAQVDAAVATIQQRYPDAAALQNDLENNELTLENLRLALHRELIFDAILQQVGAAAAEVSAIDAQLFYELQRDRFTTPEQRTARHILITINAEFAENQRDSARARLEQVAAQWNGQLEHFGQLAAQHSECPTALEAGQLGAVTRGQLYPALDAALFTLAAGAISDIVETELGFHIVLCEAIRPAVIMNFAQVQDKICALLTMRQQRECQKLWLATIP